MGEREYLEDYNQVEDDYWGVDDYWEKENESLANTKKAEGDKDPKGTDELNDEQKEELSRRIDLMFESIVQEGIIELNMGKNPFINVFNDSKNNQGKTIEELIEYILVNFNKVGDLTLKDGTKFRVSTLSKDDVYLLLVPKAKDSPIDENYNDEYDDILELDGFDFTQEFSKLNDNELSLLKSISSDILNYYKIDLNLADEGVDIEINKWNKLNKGTSFDSAVKSLLIQAQLAPEGGVIHGKKQKQWEERQHKESFLEMEEHYIRLLGQKEGMMLPNNFYYWLVGIMTIANEQKEVDFKTISSFLKTAAEKVHGPKSQDKIDSNEYSWLKVLIEKIDEDKEKIDSELDYDEIEKAMRMTLIYVSHLLVEEQKSQVVDKDGKGELKSKTVNTHSQEPTTSTQQGTYQKYDSKRSPEYGLKSRYEKPPSNFEIESKVIWMLNYNVTILNNKSEMGEK